MNFEDTAVRLWKRLEREEKIAAAARFFEEPPPEVYAGALGAIIKARHLRPQLTTVRQPIQELGATAFEVLYSMINDAGHAPRDIVLPTRLVARESCGCRPDSATPLWQVG